MVEQVGRIFNILSTSGGAFCSSLRGSSMSAQQKKAAAVCGAAVGLAVAAYLAYTRKKEKPSAGCKHPHKHLQYPRQYVAKRGTPPTIDGDVFKAAWNKVPWSELFSEITGTPSTHSPGPTKAQGTRMKMMWDDEYLYVAALLDYDEGDELVAKFEKRNSPIFHTDSDFEVFIDPVGSCHGYKELEMNAINTVWNLMLDRPYGDGGGEFSGRVAKEGESKYWEVGKQRTAARILRGALDDPSKPSQWCCEIALAHSDTLSTLGPVPNPKVGSAWRINFSRVEKKGKINWVWSPQIVWTPKEKKYRGHVAMHLPDAWGYVVFADETCHLSDGSHADSWVDPSWIARHMAMCIYYAAHAFSKERGRPAKSTTELLDEGLLPDDILGCEISLTTESFQSPEHVGFIAKAIHEGWEASVHKNRFVEVRHVGCLQNSFTEGFHGSQGS